MLSAAIVDLVQEGSTRKSTARSLSFHNGRAWKSCIAEVMDSACSLLYGLCGTQDFAANKAYSKQLHLLSFEALGPKS